MAAANIIKTRNLLIVPDGASLWEVPWTIYTKKNPDVAVGGLRFKGEAAEVTIEASFGKFMSREEQTEALEAFSYWAFRHHEVERTVIEEGDKDVIKGAGFYEAEGVFIRNKLIKSTLCYLEKDGCFLMLYRNKKKDDPCAGKWVGIGGKFEPGESSDECLVREVFEETGLKLKDYRFHGVIRFISDLWDDEDMYLFSGTGWEGDDTFAKGSFDCDEGDLVWIPKEEILSLNLWEGDKYFLEPLIRGEEGLDMVCRYEGDRLVEFIR